jgi:hypothetical protein
LASRTSLRFLPLSLNQSYDTGHLPLLLVPGRAPELPLVVHQLSLARLTNLLGSSLGRLLGSSLVSLLTEELLLLLLLGRGTRAFNAFRVGMGADLGSGLDRPVKQVVVLESLANKQVSEELAQVRVVGLVVESERSTVVEVNGKLVGEGSAQALGGGRHF